MSDIEISQQQGAVLADPTVRHDIPVPTGQAISDSRINAWWQPFDNAYVNGGVYRSGYGGVAATAYSALRYRFFRYNLAPFQAQMTGAFGIAGVFPEYDFTSRAMFLAIPSMRLSLGGEHDLFWDLKLREGIQFSAIVPVGLNYGFDYLMPLDMGVTIGRRFSEDTSLSVGIIEKMYLDTSDVQDSSQFGLNSNDLDLVFNLETHYLSAAVAVQFFNNETSIYARLWKGFELFGGKAAVALEGGGSIDAENTVQPWLLRVFLSWAYESEDDEWGISGHTSTNPLFTNYKDNIEDVEADLPWAYEIYDVGPLYNYDPTGVGISCWRTGDPTKYYCEVESEELGNLLTDSVSRLYCHQTGGSIFTCDAGSSPGLDVDFTVNATDFHEDGSFDGEINSRFNFTIDYPQIRELFENEDLDSFIASLDDYGTDDKIEFLATLNKLLYKTYDYDGLVTLNGSGDVNDIPFDEMYTRIRRGIFNEQESLPTSVCRGIANFTTYVASRWGFEAHSIGIHTGGMGHIVTMLRRRGSGEPYQFIDWGEIKKTDANTLSEAVASFCRDRGYPAQLFMRSFGPDSGFERIVITNEGQILFESVTPEDWLNEFLLF